MRHIPIGRPLAASAALLLSAAVPARAETLEDALAVAYNTNPQILAERALLEGTNEALPQALANWRPTATVTANGGKDSNLQDQACEGIQGFFNSLCQSATSQNNHGVAKTKLYESTYDVTITQPLYRGGRTTAQTSQAHNQINAERGHLAAVEQGVFATIVGDYLSVTQAVEVLDLNKQNEEILRQQVEATDQRYKLGELTHTDLYLAQAAYAQAIAQRKNAEGSLQVARANYQRDVGQAPTDLVKPAVLPELPATKDEAESIAATATPSVVQAQYGQQAAEDNIDVVRGQLLPTITAQAEYIRTADVSGRGLKVTDKRVTAQGTMPIYEGGAIYSQSRAAQKAVQQAKEQLDQTRRAAVQQAQQSWESLRAARDAITDLEHAVAVNDSALKGLEEEARVGTRTVQDVLIQQQQLFQSRVNLVQGQYTVLQSEFGLVASVGRLDARDLGLPVELYDPEKHLEAVHDKWLGFDTEP
jgi:outer membrane protein